MANKISVVIDVAQDKAISAFKGFKQSVSEADGAVGKMRAGAGSAFDSIKANAGLAGVAVVGAVGVMAKKSIEAASALGESVNAVNVTFGKSAEGIKALGEEAAESVGLSNAAFNSLAVQFSSFAETVAGDGGDVVGTLDDMTTRMADFASVMNIDVAEAARVFQSGLAGETEPLRKFGIDLSAAAVEANAYAEGIAEVGETLTESQKVQSRYNLLMKETEKTAGDFANTSDGLANSQRILAAKMEDTAAKVGKDLAPAMAAVTTVLSDIIPVAGNVAVVVGRSFEKIVDSAYAMGQGIADVVDALPFVDMPGPIAETLFKQQKLERQTADLVAEYAKGAPTMEEFIQRLKDQDISQHAINLAMIEYRKQLDGTSAAVGDTAEATAAATAATDELTEAVNRTKDGEEEAADMIDKVNATYNRQVEEVEAAAEALRELTEDMIDAVGSAFNLKQATLNLNTAYATYQESVLTTTQTLQDSETTDREKEQALRDLRTQEIGLAEDALATAEAYAQEMGAADGSAASAQFQKEKLQELAAAMPELRDEIQVYIDKLNEVPDVVRTRFEITATGATVTPHGDFIGIGGPRASGGPVAAGVGYPVGEEGVELFVPSTSGTIIPNDELGGGWGIRDVHFHQSDTTVADLAHALTMLRLSR